MKKVLLTTLYNYESIMLLCTKLGVEKLVLFLNSKPNEEQKKALELVQKALGKVIDIKTFKIDVYDIVKAAEEVVKCIDLLSDEIYVNITHGRKTQALAVLFAAYSRIKRIKAILYVCEEDKKIIYLPKLSFDLNNSQRRILESMKEKEITNLSDIKIDLSKGMLYRTVKELIDLGYVDEDLKLTDAGRIALL